MKVTKRDVVQMLQENNDALRKASKQVYPTACVTHDLITDRIKQNDTLILALSSAKEIE